MLLPIDSMDEHHARRKMVMNQCLHIMEEIPNGAKYA
jgi:hypothetical protein